MSHNNDVCFFFDFNDQSKKLLRSVLSPSKANVTENPICKRRQDTKPKPIVRYASNQGSNMITLNRIEKALSLDSTETTEDCSSVCSDDTFARGSRHDFAEEKFLLGTVNDGEDDDDDDDDDEDEFINFREVDETVDGDDEDTDTDNDLGIVESDVEHDEEKAQFNFGASYRSCIDRKQYSHREEESLPNSSDHSSVGVSSLCSNDSFLVSAPSYTKENSAFRTYDNGKVDESNDRTTSTKINLDQGSRKDMDKVHEEPKPKNGHLSRSNLDDFVSHDNTNNSVLSIPRNIVLSPACTIQTESNSTDRIFDEDIQLSAKFVYSSPTQSPSPIKGQQADKKSSKDEFGSSSLFTLLKCPHLSSPHAYRSPKQIESTANSNQTKRKVVRFDNDVTVREYKLTGGLHSSHEDTFPVQLSWEYSPSKLVPIRDDDQQQRLPFLSPQINAKKRIGSQKKTRPNYCNSPRPNFKLHRQRIASNQEITFDDAFADEYQNVLDMIRNAKFNLDKTLSSINNEKSIRRC